MLILGDTNKLKKILVIAIAALLALIVALGITLIVLTSSGKTITVEAGETVDPVKISGKNDAVFSSDFDPACTDRPGEYEITVISGDKEYKYTLKVKDTKAPTVTVKQVNFSEASGFPDPLDFIDTAIEPDTIYGEYTSSNEGLELKLNATYLAYVRYYDSSKNYTEEIEVRMKLIEDLEPPTIEVGDIIAYVGEAIAYKSNIKVTDNCVGDITLTVDDSKVDTSTAGDYPVTYKAVDLSGNETTSEAVVHVLAEKITEDKLNSRLSELVAQIITSDMSKEDQCRAIFDYVQDNIAYVSTSDKSSWVNAAYDSLFVSGAGDCFSYFAAAKAFLEYLDIENMDIERTKGYTEDTHFWSLVNIGTEDSPVWYHFDCTRLRAEYNHSGCLLTDKQVTAYNTVRENFYKYDASAYPATSTVIITPTPELDEFMD